LLKILLLKQNRGPKSLGTGHGRGGRIPAPTKGEWRHGLRLGSGVEKGVAPPGIRTDGCSHLARRIAGGEGI